MILRALLLHGQPHHPMGFWCCTCFWSPKTHKKLIWALGDIRCNQHLCVLLDCFVLRDNLLLILTAKMSLCRWGWSTKLAVSSRAQAQINPLNVFYYWHTITTESILGPNQELEMPHLCFFSRESWVIQLPRKVVLWSIWKIILQGWDVILKVLMDKYGGSFRRS